MYCRSIKILEKSCKVLKELDLIIYYKSQYYLKVPYLGNILMFSKDYIDFGIILI